MPLTCARVNPRPSTGHFPLHGGAGYILACGMSGRESPGSEDQPRLPDRALRPPVWMSGTVLIELHTGDGQELNNGISSPTSLKDRKVPPTANRVQSWLRVRAGAGQTQHPGPRCGKKGPRSQKPACYSPGLPPRFLLPHESGSLSPPQTCPQGPALALARCTVTVHIFVGISEKRL